jgi:hypothetical protein
MKKLNGFESYLVIEGLNAVRTQWQKDIKETEAMGNNTLMTRGYVDMVISETIDKIKLLTLKQK